MYNVIGTGVTAIILYVISYFFYRNGIYLKIFHQRLWNTILAITFITTALAGLFLALQINYKWNSDITKNILKRHVESGIGLAFTGIFHFLWHFSFYRNIFLSNRAATVNRPRHNISPAGISSNLFIVGFISSSVQLLLMKEIMNISGGYELIAGTFLGSWLIGSAFGSGLARNSNLSDIRKINLMFAVSPFVSLLLLILLARLFLQPGETPSFLLSVGFTFLVLIPFCLISGFTFVKLISIAKSVNSFLPGKSYSIETTGGIASGIFVSVLGSGKIDTYQMLLMIVIMGLSYVILTYFLKTNKTRIIIRFIITGIIILIITCQPDIIFRQLLLRGINITGSSDTPYGNITMAEYNGDESIYYNQRLLKYSDDAIEREEDIHYTLLQSNNPEKVLMISGSLNSHLTEINKYPVKKIVYVERDPALASIEKNSLTVSYNNLIIETGDAFRYVRNSIEEFDAVLILLPPPSSLLLNRFYTVEFFGSVKKILREGGVVSCSPGINPNYLNRESVNLYSSIYNSMARVFKNVIPIAGNKIYFIASDKSLSTSICEIVGQKNISNIYVSENFLADDLIASKTAEITSVMDRGTRLNKAEMPVASLYYQSFNLSRNHSERLPLIIVLIAAFVIPLAVIRKGSSIMYLSAFSLAGFEIILLLMLQLTLGNMYQLTGLIIAGLMAGLAAGAGTDLKPFYNGSPRIKTLILILFYLLMVITISKMLDFKAGPWMISLLIPAAFIPGFLTGGIFRDLTKVENLTSDAAGIYSADLAGSAMGFILFSGIAIPLLGIRVSLIFLSVLLFAGFIAALFGKK